MHVTTSYMPPGLALPEAGADFNAFRAQVAQPTPTQLEGLAQRLAAASAPLRQTPLAAIVAALDAVARRWLSPAHPPRQALRSPLAAVTGLSLPMIDHILDRMPQDWLAPALWTRLRAEFGDPALLDGWQPTPSGQSRVWGPRLIWHVGAGNVLGVAVQSLVDGLLVKAPALIKTGSGEPLLAAAWAAELAAELPVLAEALAVLWWPGGAVELEQAVLRHAEAVIVNGSNAAIDDLRRRLPAGVRLLDYGSRLSWALVTAELAAAPVALAAALAYDIAVFDQHGCVSPQIIVVEHADARAFATALAAALAAQEYQLPRGTLAPDQASAVRAWSDAAEWRELSGSPVQMFGSPADRWRVVLDAEAAFAPGCGARNVLVRPLADLAELPALLAPWQAYQQSVALAAPPARAPGLASMLAELGVTRITAPGRQGWPAPAWHHDGRQPLAALVRWSDWEASDVL